MQKAFKVFPEIFAFPFQGDSAPQYSCGALIYYFSTAAMALAT